MSVRGKRILITGANGGIGRPTCQMLLEDGAASVVMACRSELKAEAARADVLAVTGATEDRVSAAAGFDMLDPDALRAAVERLPADRPFDVVFLQAGGWIFADDYQTVSWDDKKVERTVFQNVFGGHVTLAALKGRALLAPGCRVVTMGGEGARGIPRLIARPDFKDAGALERYIRGDFSGWPAYKPVDALGTSKLVGALWAQKLAASKGDDLEVIWFSPGFTGGTGGTGGMPAWKEKLFQKVGFPLMVALGQAQWPQTAARKCTDCLAGKIGENGDVIGAPEGVALGELVDQKPMHPAFTDSALQDALWAIVEETVGPLSEAG